MQKPLQCSAFFLTGKLELIREIPIIEFKGVLRTENRLPVLIEKSENITEATYSHFKKDDMKLKQLNTELSRGEYVISTNAYQSVLRKLNLMEGETVVYKGFEENLGQLPLVSRKLRYFVEATGLITDIIAIEIENTKALLKT